MLRAVQAIHDENIIHSDLKPANFMLVSGSLKLIDFGIARAIGNDTTNIHRDYQTGTINYMSPETLNITPNHEFKLGRASDVWSLGCILYQFIYGFPPFSKITNMMVKMRTIADPKHIIEFHGDEPEVQVAQSCLQFEARKRPTIPELLKHVYITGESGDSKSREEWEKYLGKAIENIQLEYVAKEFRYSKEQIENVSRDVFAVILKGKQRK